jgi:hypothetical protein
MKFLKVLSILFMLSTSASANADWTPLFEAKTYNVYMDKSTLVRSGNIAKVWIMYDYKEKLNGEIASMKDLNVFHCKNVESRAIARIAYSEPMGKGAVIFSVLDKIKTPPPFAAIAPGSIAKGFFKIACKK